MMRKLLKGDGIGRRLRLSCREIALALALTIAAMAFIVAAVKTQGTGKLVQPIATGDRVNAD